MRPSVWVESTRRATGSGRWTTGLTTYRCSRRRVPRKGYRHLLKRRDLERFVELIPAWDELSEGPSWIVLSRNTDYFGWHVPGVVAVCAWETDLWHRDLSKGWYWEHVDVLERLGVDVWKDGPHWVAEWTEDQARAFQLLNVFLHELGHHHDRMTTRSTRRPARGESYAEQFGRELADEMWDDFLRVFPL